MNRIYYSQHSPVYAHKPYTITGDPHQTIARSGCAPTCAAMIVSSLRETISPLTMANIFLEAGFRTEDTGTSWEAFDYIGKIWELETESIASFDNMISCLQTGGMVAVSLSEGFLANNGHIITLSSISKEGVLTILDPDLINNPAKNSPRIQVEETRLYCPIDTFARDSNYKGLFTYNARVR